MTLTQYQKDFLTKLISIKSVGGEASEGAPYGREPREALDYFLNEAQKAGFKTGVVGDRAGFVEFGEGDRMLGIVCHVDVVPVGDGWNTDPFELTFKETDEYGTVMIGRGIIDDKGPAAASFLAMKELLDEGKTPDNYKVRLILGTDEERTASCIEYYTAHEQIPDFSITPDAEFPVIFSEKSIFRVSIKDTKLEGFTANGGSAPNMVPAQAKCSIEGKEFKATGKPAHAARTDLGINAIELLARQLDDNGIDLNKYPLLKFIRDFNGEEFTGCKTPDESGILTSNIGILTVNENECSILIDFRVPISYDLDEVFQILSRKAEEYGLEAVAEEKLKGIYTDKNSPSVVKLTDIWSKHMSKISGFKEGYRKIYTDAVSIGGGTYAKFIPNTVAYGFQAPWQEDQCHKANEFAFVSDFLEWIKIIKDVIETFE